MVGKGKLEQQNDWTPWSVLCLLSIEIFSHVGYVAMSLFSRLKKCSSASAMLQTKNRCDVQFSTPAQKKYEYRQRNKCTADLSTALVMNYLLQTIVDSESGSYRYSYDRTRPQRWRA